MTDLAKGQPAWTRFIRKLAFFLKKIRVIEDVKRKFALNSLGGRTQIVEENDNLSSTSGWSLAGVELGVNTDVDGLTYVGILDETPVGGATISLYTARGPLSGLVAQGSAANGAVATLAAQNSSGLSGTVTVGTVGANETDGLHRLRLFPDFPVQARELFDGTDDEDPDMMRVSQDGDVDVFATLSAAQDRIAIQVADFMRIHGAAFLQVGTSTTTVPFVSGATRDDDGLIVSNFGGLLEELRNDMEDETSPAEQTVLYRNITVGAPAFDSNNDGVGTMVTPTVKEYARAGRVSLVCTEDAIGSERFTVEQRYDQTGHTQPAGNKLTIKRAYSDPSLGIISATLLRTMVLTTAGVNFAAIANWTIDGETDANTDDGTIYLRIEEHSTPGTFRINGYSSSGYTTTTRVFTTDYVVAVTSVAIQAVNGSGFSGTAMTGSAPVDAAIGNIDLQPFKTTNATGVPDKITFTITVTSEGLVQAYVGRFLGYALNSAAAAETIDDGLLGAGTFAPYEAQDA